MAQYREHDAPYVVLCTVGVRKEYGVVILLSYPLLKESKQTWSDTLLREYNTLPDNITVDGEKFFTTISSTQ